MRVSEAINSRRSMRVFKPDPVPKQDVEWIIANATRAASNGNLQPWKLYVTMGAARQRLSAAILKAMDNGDTGPGGEYDVYPKEFTPVYDQRRKLVGKQLYTLVGVPRGDAAGMLKQFRKNYDFFDAPIGMILCVERRMGNGQWIDCGSTVASSSTSSCCWRARRACTPARRPPSAATSMSCAASSAFPRTRS